MLHSITWGQFGTALLPMAIIYYLYVLLKFYKHELVVFFSGNTGGPKDQAAVTDGAARAPGAPRALEAAVKEEAPAQPGLFDRQGVAAAGLPGLAGEGGQGVQDATPEMFKVMEKVVTVLKSVVAQGVTTGIGREELVAQIGEVLERFGHLKGTPYQGAVNNFLVRTCSSNFSLVLEEEDLAALWN